MKPRYDVAYKKERIKHQLGKFTAYKKGLELGGIVNSIATPQSAEIRPCPEWSDQKKKTENLQNPHRFLGTLARETCPPSDLASNGPRRGYHLEPHGVLKPVCRRPRWRDRTGTPSRP